MRGIGQLKLSIFGGILFYLALVPVNGSTVTYQVDSTTDFPNPERGFYCQTNQDYLLFNTERLIRVRRDSLITVIRVYYRLDSFVNTDILPKVFLDKLLADGDTLRKAGAKMIPRFIYNMGAAGCKDAPLPRLLLHINQLAPALRANRDVIAFIEAGFIGKFGEWHYYNCTPQDPNSHSTTANQRAVLFRILDMVPGIMVNLRYNFHKRAIFNSNTPLEPDSAFCGSHRARTGATNDAFASTVDNMGTYEPSDPASLEAQKLFLSRDNRYVPQSGEPEAPKDNNTANCDSAKKDLRRMHWDLLNHAFERRMHALWQTQGCRDEIRRKIGYRIALLNATLEDSVRPGSVFSAVLRLQNTGYGKLFNPRGCELVLRNVSTQEKYPVRLDIDPRRWCMTDSVVTVDIAAQIPATLSTGHYKVYLNLPDTASRLYSRKEYAIRLANTNVWEDSTGYNSLLHSIYISPGVSTIGSATTPPLPWFKTLNITRQGELICFAFKAVPAAPVSLEVYSLSGSKLWSRTINPGSAGTRVTASAKLPSGMYLLKATFENRLTVGGVRSVAIRRFFK